MLGHDERLDAHDLAAKLGERDADGRVESEDALEDSVRVLRNREDRAEEVGVAEVGAEGLVGRASLLPRVASACEVDENDAERPDVVVGSRVRSETLEETALAFCRSETSRVSCVDRRHRGGPLDGRTGRHVESRATSKITARLLSRRQTEICEHDLLAIFEAENVLGLEVAVEDPLRVTVLDRVDDLEEDATDEFVVPEVPLSLRDHAEQISLFAELQDDVDARFLLDHVVERDHVRVPTREAVESDLATLECTLARVEADLVEALDGVEGEVAELRVRAGRRLSQRAGSDVAGEVHNSVRSESENRDKLEVREGVLRRVVDDVPDEVLRMRRIVGGHGSLSLGERVGWRREWCW